MLGHSPFEQRPDVFTFEEYHAFVADAWPRYRTLDTVGRVRITTEYQRRLPLYAIARCPFCEAPIPERVDTFSLNGFGWDRPSAGLGWGETLGERIKLAERCPHTRIIDFFLNLRGRTPDDLFPSKVIRAGPGVPCVMLVPMRAPDARAVIHVLPIARFDDAEPRHHYSVYFMTYFTETPDSFDAATRDWGVHYGLVEYGDVDFDLNRWAEDERLLWLDPDDPELRLLHRPDATFPYASIEGGRDSERLITRTGQETPQRPLIDRVLNAFRRR